MNAPIDSDQLFAKLEALISAAEAVRDDVARERTRAVVNAVLELHAAGLSRIVEVARAQGDAGQELIATLSGDALLCNLFTLHGLHPEPFEARVRRGLEKAAMYLKLTHSSVEVVALSHDSVKLKLARSGDDGTTNDRVRNAVEQALREAAPDLAEVHFDESSAQERARP